MLAFRATLSVSEAVTIVVVGAIVLTLFYLILSAIFRR